MKLNLRNRYNRDGDQTLTKTPKDSLNHSPVNIGGKNTARRSTNVVITIKKRPGNKIIKHSLTSKNAKKKTFDFNSNQLESIE